MYFQIKIELISGFGDPKLAVNFAFNLITLDDHSVTKLIVIFILCCFCPWTSSSQSKLPTKDSVYVFWQPENQLTYNYKGPSSSKAVHAALGLWTVLDLPDNTELLTPKQMRIYIAPVCNRHMSYARQNDSVELAIQTIYFNILEVSARAARVKLSQLPDSAMSTRTLSKTFKAIVQEMHENRLRMNRKFHREMFRDKGKDALKTWQQKLRQKLDSTVSWATQPVDCFRFLQNHPLEKGYREDLSSNAVVLSDKYEQVLGRDTWHAEFCQISRLRK